MNKFDENKSTTNADYKNDLLTEDYEFILDMMEIEYHFPELTKHDQIRVEKWSNKLCLLVCNVAFKKVRNQIARLLLVNCRSRRLIDQFKRSPPDGPLEMFDKTLFYGLRKLFVSRRRPAFVIERFELMYGPQSYENLSHSKMTSHSIKSECEPAVKNQFYPHSSTTPAKHFLLPHQFQLDPHVHDGRCQSRSRLEETGKSVFSSNIVTEVNNYLPDSVDRQDLRQIENSHHDPHKLVQAKNNHKWKNLKSLSANNLSAYETRICELNKENEILHIEVQKLSGEVSYLKESNTCLSKESLDYKQRMEAELNQKREAQAEVVHLNSKIEYLEQDLRWLKSFYEDVNKSRSNNHQIHLKHESLDSQVSDMKKLKVNQDMKKGIRHINSYQNYINNPIDTYTNTNVDSLENTHRTIANTDNKSRISEINVSQLKDHEISHRSKREVLKNIKNGYAYEMSTNKNICHEVFKNTAQNYANVKMQDSFDRLQDNLHKINNNLHLNISSKNDDTVDSNVGTNNSRSRNRSMFKTGINSMSNSKDIPILSTLEKKENNYADVYNNWKQKDLSNISKLQTLDSNIDLNNSQFNRNAQLFSNYDDTSTAYNANNHSETTKTSIFDVTDKLSEKYGLKSLDTRSKLDSLDSDMEKYYDKMPEDVQYKNTFQMDSVKRQASQMYDKVVRKI